MKKLYGTIAIVSVLLAHSALRLVMADAYTFSSTDYNASDLLDMNAADNTPIFEPVSVNKESVPGSGITSPMLNRTMFLTSSARSIHGFNN